MSSLYAAHLLSPLGVEVDMVDCPKVSYVLLSYNQCDYIAEAVKSALLQDYENIQFIFSDDASKDNTYSIIESLSCSDRRRESIVLNKNKKNLGVGGHVNKVLDLAEGDLIVFAAGDDISRSDRVRVLVQHWLRTGKPWVLCSGFTLIDAKGLVKANYCGESDSIPNDTSVTNKSKMGLARELLEWKIKGLYGATSAWSRDLWQVYGEFSSDVWYEDRVAFLRALLGEGISLVNEELVFYRQHSGSISNRAQNIAIGVDEIWNSELSSIVDSQRKIGTLEQNISDLNLAARLGSLDAMEASNLEILLRNQIKVLKLRSAWWEQNTIARLQTFWRLLRSPSMNHQKGWFWKRMFGRKAFVFFAAIYRRIR